jgi:steroid Delta-isomerase
MARNAREAFEAHAFFWNNGDRRSWIALFADDVTFDDPVGVPTKHGRAALETSWDRSNQPGRSWRLEPRRIMLCGNEAAVDLLNHGDLDGVQITVGSIEIWRVNARGLVDAVRVYFEADPRVHDPYYVPNGP